MSIISIFYHKAFFASVKVGQPKCMLGNPKLSLGCPMDDHPKKLSSNTGFIRPLNICITKA